MDALLFTPVQLISLLGMAQSLYALVYMGFRAGKILRASLAILYFFLLFGAFFTDLSTPFFPDSRESLFYIAWFLWFLLPSLSYLLILQIAKIHEMPSWQNYAVLCLPCGAFIVGFFFFQNIDGLYLMGVISGGVSLLCIWFKKSLLEDLRTEGKGGHPRYWLVMCLIIVNLVFLIIALSLVLNFISYDNWIFIRNILGLGFVYLASTSLFRIYPQAVLVKERRRFDLHNQKNRALIDSLQTLLEQERVYQEPQYSRKDLAQALKISEAIVSRLVNDHYQATVPQLLNQYRVEEAKTLLNETKASIQIISTEVGFNSLTSFNRVFKEVVGRTPSQFRAQK